MLVGCKNPEKSFRKKTDEAGQVIGLDDQQVNVFFLSLHRFNFFKAFDFWNFI